MSGLYNLLFGINQCAAGFLTALNIDYQKVPRFRDCFLSADGKAIIIYTRTGGGNRSEYSLANQAIRQWDGYLRDEDDGFDSTYALFYFAIPESIKAECAALFEAGFGVDPAKRWKDVLENIGKTPTGG